ncbi:MAG: hypothetical protein HY017_25660 [Betaproteobacteria bacterium]|nr:hypothetical protein [Betaproteobacteria bacterium]
MQPNPEVFCHYYVYQQRPEDRVLRALVRKTDTIRRELGSFAPVISNRLIGLLKQGIRRGEAERIAHDIDDSDLETDKKGAIEEELEASRER